MDKRRGVIYKLGQKWLNQNVTTVDNSKWHPVTYFNKTLSLVKQNYKIYNKKILVII